MPGKREGYLSWDEYFMKEAELATERSKDPSTQVGACIVGDDNRILSKGYNGLTRGMDDDKFNWLSTGEETGDILNIKNTFVVHAEHNAILNYSGDTRSLQGSTIYVTLFPCTECTKSIIQSGIKKVVYGKMYKKPIYVEASKIMFDAAGVEYISYEKLLEQSKENEDKEHQKMLKRF